MGIKNFRKFILSKIPDPTHKISFEDHKIKSVCIDINIFIYKFITAIRRTGKDLIQNNKIISHTIGLRNQINLFEKLNITPIYVFDGEPPKEKASILIQRNKIKQAAEKEYAKTRSIQSYQQSFSITDEILDTAKEYLKERHVKYIDMPDLEADMICAALVKQKIVDCVYTTDFDVLAFGAKCMLINIDYRRGYFEFIFLKDILKSLNISYEQFVDMIVAAGCDYCEGMEGMTLNKAYKGIADIKLNKAGKKAKEIFTMPLKIIREDMR